MENPVTTLSKWDSGVWSRRNIPLSLGICFFAMYVKWIPEGLSGLPNATHLVVRGSLNSDYGVVFSGLFPWISWKPCRDLVLVERKRAMGVPRAWGRASHSQNWMDPLWKMGTFLPCLWDCFSWSRLNPFCFLWIFFLFLFFSTNSVQCTVFW